MTHDWLPSSLDEERPFRPDFPVREFLGSDIGGDLERSGRSIARCPSLA